MSLIAYLFELLNNDFCSNIIQKLLGGTKISTLAEERIEDSVT